MHACVVQSRGVWVCPCEQARVQVPWKANGRTERTLRMYRRPTVVPPRPWAALVSDSGAWRLPGALAGPRGACLGSPQGGGLALPSGAASRPGRPRRPLSLRDPLPGRGWGGGRDDGPRRSPEKPGRLTVCVCCRCQKGDFWP